MEVIGKVLSELFLIVMFFGILGIIFVFFWALGLQADINDKYDL